MMDTMKTAKKSKTVIKLKLDKKTMVDFCHESFSLPLNEHATH